MESGCFSKLTYYFFFFALSHKTVVLIFARYFFDMTDKSTDHGVDCE